MKKAINAEYSLSTLNKVRVTAPAKNFAGSIWGQGG